MRHNAIQQAILSDKLAPLMASYLNSMVTAIELTAPIETLGLALRNGATSLDTDFVGYVITIYNGSPVTNLPRNSGLLIPTYPTLEIAFYHGPGGHSLGCMYSYSLAESKYVVRVQGNLGFPIYSTWLLSTAADMVKDILTQAVLDENTVVVFEGA